MVGSLLNGFEHFLLLFLDVIRSASRLLSQILDHDSLLELVALNRVQDQAHIFVFLKLLFNSLLHVVVHWRSDRLVHPVVAPLLIDHALVESFLLIHAVTAAFPIRRPAHLLQTTVVESAANILARIHRHVLNGEPIRIRVGVPFLAVLQALNIEGLRVFTRSQLFGIFVRHLKKQLLLVRRLIDAHFVLSPEVFRHYILNYNLLIDYKLVAQIKSI